MNKLREMGKTNLEVMKMRKNNRENPFPLRKYYGVMIVGFVLFLGVMAYYSVQFRQKREIAKQEVELEQKSVGVNNSATQGTTQTETTTEKRIVSTQETKSTMNQGMSYDGTSKLIWPLQGNILLPYSVESTVYFESLDQYRINKGILIEAKEGASVKAVKQAKVEKIQKSAEYGQTILLDLGSGYRALYGQMKKISVKEGQVVEKGQVIGQVAAPTDYYTLEGTNLYFQMEKDKKSVDPGKYLE